MTYTPIPRGTQNWDVPLNSALAQLDSSITSASGTALQAANNLSDLTNVPQARTNLNLTGLANALSNMTATTNPLVTSDNTQGYSIGSTWFNTATNAMFVATSVATGAAVWLQIPPTFVDRTTNQSVGGVKTFTSPMNSTHTIDESSISSSYTATNTTNAAYAYTGNATTGRYADARVTGDTNGRFAVLADGAMSWGAGNASRDTTAGRGASATFDVGPSFAVGGVDQGRGLTTVAFQASNVTGVTTTETLVVNTNSITWVAGRAYRITVCLYGLSSVAGDTVQVRLRRGTLGGTLWHDWFAAIGITAGGGSNNVPFLAQKLVRRTAGTDLVQALTVTGNRNTGTGTVAFNQSATNQTYILVEDIGTATAWATAFDLT